MPEHLDLDTPCDRLEWDSAFFGFPIARHRGRRLDEALAARVEAWAAAHGVRCLYLLADLADAATVRLAEQYGYRLVDVRTTYEVRLDQLKIVVPDARMPAIRLATPEDVPALREIARTTYRGGTRFYNDPGFSESQCDDLYAAWIERSVHGWADCVYALGPVGAAYGYITCHRDGRMGISGLREDMRGRGEGVALYQTAFNWFVEQRLEPIRLVTQGTNIRIQQLFQKFGARVTEIALWYHRWPGSGADSAGSR